MFLKDLWCGIIIIKTDDICTFTFNKSTLVCQLYMFTWDLCFHDDYKPLGLFFSRIDTSLKIEHLISQEGVFVNGLLFDLHKGANQSLVESWKKKDVCCVEDIQHL